MCPMGNAPRRLVGTVGLPLLSRRLLEIDGTLFGRSLVSRLNQSVQVLPGRIVTFVLIAPYKYPATTTTLTGYFALNSVFRAGLAG